jgi:hypothetical protein
VSAPLVGRCGGTDCAPSQVPVLNDVRDITISKDGKYALVSYENKVGSVATLFPPPLTVVANRLHHNSGN